MALLIPNILSADKFQVQADARDARFTWKREGSKDIPGLVIASKPSLRFPLPGAADASALRQAIDAAASQDDAMAWAFAARWWISFAWERYQEAGPDGAWEQLDWAGAKNPDLLLPEQKSLINGLSMGGLEILADKPWLLTGSWAQYFTSLIGQVVLKAVELRVSTLIDIQMAMRSVSWWMSSMIASTQVQFSNVDPCTISLAWNATPSAKCEMQPYLAQLNNLLLKATPAEFAAFQETAANLYKALQAAVSQGKLTKVQAFSYLDELLRLDEQWSISCNDCQISVNKDPISSPTQTKYQSLFTQLYDDYQYNWRPGKNGNPG